MLLDPVDDQVVDDAPALVGQQRVLGGPDLDLAQVVREQRLEQVDRVHALDLELAHVGDVEDAAVLPDGAMLGDDALVLDGHLPAGEGHEAGPGGDVPVVERGVVEGLRHRAGC